MKTISRVLASLVLVATAGVVSAQMKTPTSSSYYGEVGYTATSIGDASLTFKPQLIRFVVGKEINQNLSVEGMFAPTIAKDTYRGVDIKAQTYGIYLKPKLEIAKDTEAFARLGWAKSQLDLSANGASESLSDSSVAFGAGVQTQFNKDVYGQIDYMRFYSKDGVKADGLTFSVGTRF